VARDAQVHQAPMDAVAFERLALARRRIAVTEFETDPQHQ
jgi:hypothetical protein